MTAKILPGAHILPAIALLACATTLVRSQEESRPSQPKQGPASNGLVIRAVVRRVVVDVVVTDSQGKPVRGLTQQDFSLAEDGKEQRVLSFDTHDLDTPSDVPPHLPALPVNTFVNVPVTPERGPLYVILYDMVNTSTDDQPFAHQQLLKFIDKKPPGTRFAMFVLADGLRLIQGFTEDSTTLLSALNQRSKDARIPRMFLYGDNYGRGDVLYTTSVLIAIAHFLEGLPGRKNLLWIAGSFPSSVLPGAESGTNNMAFGGDPAEGASYGQEIKEATDAMARGQIAVYPVDVRGVAVDFASGQHLALNASYLTENAIADATGGRAFYSSNRISDALSEATDTGANYYTLTYSPTNQNYNGRLRKIHVDLARHGYHLAYRRSYFGDENRSSAQSKTLPPSNNNQTLPAAQPSDSLYANMLHGAPLAHELFFKAHIHAMGAPAKATPEQMSSLAEQPAYFRERRKIRPDKPLPPVQVQTYAIDYTMVALPPGGRTTSIARPPRLEIAVAVFDAEGMMLNGVVQDTDDTGTGQMQSNSRTASQEPAQHGIYRAQQQIDVPLNAVSIRVAVRDASTDRIGALEVPLPLAPEPQAQAATPANGQPTSGTPPASAKPN